MAENVEQDNAKGRQPRRGVPPPSYDDFIRVESVDAFTGLPALDEDDSIATALIGEPPRPGKKTIQPAEKHLFSSVRNFRMLLDALGKVEEGNRSTLTITITGIAGDILLSDTRVRVNTAWNTVTETVLSEGSDWVVGVSTTTAATNLAAAIHALAGISATSNLGVVTVTRDTATNYFDVHASYGTDATIARGGAWFHRGRGSARGQDKRYMSCQWSKNNRVTSVVDCEPKGFTLEGSGDFVHVTTPIIGSRYTGAQFRPTWTPTAGTGNHRPFIQGRSRDTDSAALSYNVRVSAGLGGEIPFEAATPVVYLESRLSTGSYGLPRPVYLDRPWKIRDGSEAETGLRIIFPRGATTARIVTPSGLKGDTFTVTVTTAAGSTNTVLTEGTHWFALGYTAAQAAKSLAYAINENVDGVVADVVSDTVHVHRHITTDASTITGITLATSAGGDITLITEANGNTLTAGDVLTISTRDTPASPTILSDTRFQWNSLELTLLSIRGAAWRIRPRSFKLTWVRGLMENDFVGADDSTQDHPHNEHGMLTCEFTVRVEDNQYLNAMENNDSITNVIFEFEGDPIGSTTERERVRITIGQGVILPFEKSISGPFEDVETWTVRAKDSAISANDFIDVQIVNAVETVGALVS